MIAGTDSCGLNVLLERSVRKANKRKHFYNVRAVIFKYLSISFDENDDHSVPQPQTTRCSRHFRLVCGEAPSDTDLAKYKIARFQVLEPAFVKQWDYGGTASDSLFL